MPFLGKHSLSQFRLKSFTHISNLPSKTIRERPEVFGVRPETFKFGVRPCTFVLICRGWTVIIFYLKGKFNAVVYVFSSVHPFPEVCRPKKLIISYPWRASIYHVTGFLPLFVPLVTSCSKFRDPSPLLRSRSTNSK